MKFVCTALTFGLTATAAFAGHETIAPGKTTVVAVSPFDKGGHEFQLGVGYNFALNSDTDLRPNIEDLDLYARFGWMLTSPEGSGFFRGNWEFLAEVVAAAVTDGPGEIIAGGTAILRYNFVQPDSKWVPYFQISGGGVYNDIYKERPQRLIGQGFEFNLGAALGLRYLINDHVACYVEADYRHISNAGLADRNYGLNSVGGQLGVSWFF